MRWLAALALSTVVLVAPATSPAIAQTASQPTVVTFAAGSDELGPAARARLDGFAKEARGKDVSVVIAGHATLVEAKAAILAEGGATPAEAEQSASGFAVGLSQRRANNVRE